MAVQGVIIQDVKVKKEHGKAIKYEIAVNSNKIPKNEYPKCSGILLERPGKYDKFKGAVGNSQSARFVHKNA